MESASAPPIRYVAHLDATGGPEVLLDGEDASPHAGRTVRLTTRRELRGFVMDHDMLYWFDWQTTQVVSGEFIPLESPGHIARADDSDQWVGENTSPDC